MSTENEPVARGRYSMYAGDGCPVIAYTRDLCASCADCGCGTQAEPLDFTRKGLMKTVMRGREWMKDSGMKLPILTGGGDGGPRRGRR